MQYENIRNPNTQHNRLEQQHGNNNLERKEKRMDNEIHRNELKLKSKRAAANKDGKTKWI